VTVRLKLGEIEGGLEAVRPIMSLPEDRQISWIHARLSDLSQILGQERYRNSAAAVRARDELQAYAIQSASHRPCPVAVRERQIRSGRRPVIGSVPATHTSS
jgi:hypothetical protein